jgi:hypothetical protein
VQSNPYPYPYPICTGFFCIFRALENGESQRIIENREQKIENQGELGLTTVSVSAILTDAIYNYVP